MAHYILLIVFIIFPSVATATDLRVVVKTDAAFFPTEDDPDPVMQPKKIGYATFEFVETRGSRFHIRTVPGETFGTHCYDGIAIGYKLALDFWVESKDVMWVTTSPLEANYEDGTSIALDAGVVLTPGKNSVSWTTDFGFELPVTTSDANKVFPNTKKSFIASSDRVRATDVEIASRALGEIVVRGKAKTTGELTSFEMQCARVVARLTKVSNERPKIKSAIREKRGEAIKAGSVLFWTSGLRAGTVVEALSLVDGSEVAKHHNRRCFEIAPDAIVLCADVDAVVASAVINNALGKLNSGKRVPIIQKGGVTIGPAIAKETIRRVIRSKIKHVKYCYEKTLVKTPDISGTVQVKFSIQADGSVKGVEVASSTLHNSDVEDCVAKQISTLKFPEPRGGGIVIVNYPFEFVPAP